jgi:hypothetical protein
MVHVDFHLYSGLAGDPHVLLVGKSEEGVKLDVLYSRTLPFPVFRLRRLKNRLLKQMEALTGKAHSEK